MLDLYLLFFFCIKTHPKTNNIEPIIGENAISKPLTNHNTYNIYTLVNKPKNTLGIIACRNRYVVFVTIKI
jgi:hypothetical protein